MMLKIETALLMVALTVSLGVLSGCAKTSTTEAPGGAGDVAPTQNEATSLGEGSEAGAPGRGTMDQQEQRMFEENQHNNLGNDASTENMQMREGDESHTGENGNVGYRGGDRHSPDNVQGSR